MPSKWPMMTLAEAGVILLDCVHKTPVVADTGYPYITIPEMVNGHLNFEAARRISHQDFVEWTRKTAPQTHDVVLSRRCNPGETAYVPSGTEFALGQNLVLLRADGQYIYPPFLRWLTRSPEWWEQVHRFLNVGAVFDSLKCADVPNFSVPAPPLDEQRRITEVLDSLDNKIELNRRMNATLEAMAQAIFKSWFVDFDPVRAKMEGREPAGMDAETAALFPDGFEVVDGREVPVGWKISTIGAEVQVVGGSTPSTKNSAFWDEGSTPFATPKDMSQLTSPVLLETERCITEAGLNTISSGLLPKGTVLLSSRAPIGYLAIAEVPVAVNQGFIAMVCNGTLSNHYVLHWTRGNMERIKANANGSTFQEISKKNFRPIEVVVPSSKALERYDGLIHPIYEQITNNVRQSHTLAALRDTLLPKLISGEIRVPVTTEQNEERATV